MGIAGRIRFIARSYINDFMDDLHAGRMPTFGDDPEDAAARAEAEEWLRQEQAKRARRQKRSSPHHRARGGLSRDYANLEVDHGADFATVQKARRRLLKKYHPDRFQDPEEREKATRISMVINESYQRLKNHLKGRRR